MINPDEVSRDYDMPDRDELERAQGFHDALEENISDFEVKYPFIDAQYVSKFQDDIDAAKDAVRDNEVVTDISLDVSIIEGYMSDGRNLYMKLIQYAHLVYPKNPAMINTFGHKDYEKSRNSHNLLPIVLEQAFRKANDPAVKALLIAKGLTALEITNIDLTCKKIILEAQKIYNAKAHRPQNTQVRIIKSNIVWATMSEISLCSKDVYSDNYAKRHMFLLYSGAGGEDIPPVPPVPPIIE